MLMTPRPMPFVSLSRTRFPSSTGNGVPMKNYSFSKAQRYTVSVHGPTLPIILVDSEKRTKSATTISRPMSTHHVFRSRSDAPRKIVS